MMDQDHACFVYGVTTPRVQIPSGLTGVQGSPVRMVEFSEEVAAVVGDVAIERPPGRRDDLVAYSEVLDTLARSGPVAPVRFGSMLVDDRDVVEQLLAPDHGYFVDLLAELRDRSEFTLRATYHEDVVLAEVVAEDGEIAELHRLTRGRPVEEAYGENVRLGELVAAALEHKRGRDADGLLEAVAPYVAAYQLRREGGVDHVLDVALLVDDRGRDDFELALEELAETVHERIRLRLVGPIAPYDFVAVE